MGERSLILERGKSPADWAAMFADKGIVISERSLRQRARQIGACYTFGKAMLITPPALHPLENELWT